MLDWQPLFSALREHDIDVSDQDMPCAIGGGCTSTTWRINSASSPVFLKTGPAAAFEMFAAEAQGLQALAAVNAIKVPAVLGCVHSGSESFLALEWIDFESTNPATESLLGRRIAALHRHCAENFGWVRDNTIGATLQRNDRMDDWVSFYAEHRLGYQLELAARNGYSGSLQNSGRRLLNNIGNLFHNYWPEPSLLHGDLWGGNWAASAGAPVIFDPAVYYGDRETDLAMTRLFGGFGPAFYAAYAAEWPLADGHEQRVHLYQLYHVLNHLNLFGPSYLARAEHLLARTIHEGT